MKPTRRTVLRGLGTVVALPWLEALAPARAAEATRPSRLLVYTFPNSMPPSTFQPAGSDWTGSAILAPLARMKHKAALIRGVDNLPRGTGSEHATSGVNLLTGAAVGTMDAPPADMVSLDQLVAQSLGPQTRFPSLELSSEGDAACSSIQGIQSDQSCAYYWTVSWADGRTPLPRLRHPRLAFDRLFSSTHEGDAAIARARRAASQQSVLDYVLADATRLDRRLGAADRQRLDQFLTQVHELERRLEQDTPDDPSCRADASTLDADIPPGAIDIEAHVRLMRELMVLAFGCDRTRVISYMLGSMQSERPYRHLGISEGHHWLSHHGGNADRIDKISRIGAWEVEVFTQLLEALDAVDLGGRTLLDDTAVMFLNGLGDPDTHLPYDIPLVLAGGGGALPQGQLVSAPEGTILSQVHLSVARALGLGVSRFGTTSDPLFG